MNTEDSATNKPTASPARMTWDYADIVHPEEMREKQARLAEMLTALRHPTPAAVITQVKQGFNTLQMGRSALCAPLRLNSTVHAAGLGTHSDSIITITLPQPGRRLTGLAGVDDNPCTRHHTNTETLLFFAVEIDGSAVWRSGPQRVDADPALVDCDLHGCREFTLTATSPPREGPNQGTHADWVDLQVTLDDGSTLALGTPALGAGFSFRCNDHPAAELLPNWTLVEDAPETHDDFRLHRLSWTDPATGLQAIIEIREYTAFPVLEWLVRFRNTGTTVSPLLEEIRSLDVTLPPHAVLHYHTGDYCAADGYEPHQLALEPDSAQDFAPDGGRPTNRAWPYYNLEYPTNQRGVIAVVGWAGQWAAHFTGASNAVRMTAGQELARFTLLPGEEVRTPLSVLLFWRGDRVRAQNLWRRWMLACNLPRPGGALPAPMLPAYTGRWFAEMALATMDTQRAFLDRYREEGIALDYWWIDAGWYPCDGDWTKTGTWEPDAKRFPHGLREIADYARTKGMQTLVWFEPERVAEGTWLAAQHPEWLLPGGCLLNLGNPDALAWLIEHISRTIREQGIDLYRQDFNIDPLDFWRQNDAPDRQGITEIRYVEGYLHFWRELLRRFPDMLIDSCASGGRRNDLETMRLSVPLHKTDYDYADLPVKQAFFHSLASWLPYFGAYDCSLIDGRTDPYAFRSSLAPMTMLTDDLRRRDIDWSPLRKLTEEWRRVTETGGFFGDYYPLTTYNRDAMLWIGWQFHRPDTGAGLVQAFRRPDSPFETARFKLHGLDATTDYLVTDLDEPDTAMTVSGKALMESGLAVTMPQAPQAKVMVYEIQRG